MEQGNCLPAFACWRGRMGVVDGRALGCWRESHETAEQPDEGQSRRTREHSWRLLTDDGAGSGRELLLECERERESREYECD